MKRRSRFKSTLEERLTQRAEQLREKAQSLPPGAERDFTEKQARQADTAGHVNDWLTSPGLQPPT